MTDHDQIEMLLIASLKDDKFSNDEKSALHTFLAHIQKQTEMLSYTRNKAFDLFKEHYHASSENLIKGTNWLERVIKTIDNVRGELIPQRSSAYFSPGTSCLSQIVSSIGSARHTIDVCVFTISDDRISDALLKAHKAGVKVRIVSDNDKSNDLGSDIVSLAGQGVPVKLDRSRYHMHHKFALFDQRTLINGSFNWTRSATTSNEENITVLYDKHLIDAFSNSFSMLWEECRAI